MIVPVWKEYRSASERSITKVPSGPVSSVGNISPQNCCSPRRRKLHYLAAGLKSSRRQDSLRCVSSPHEAGLAGAPEHGHGRSFCFPCYKKIMVDHYGKKKDKALVDRKYDKETAVYGSTI